MKHDRKIKIRMGWMDNAECIGRLSLDSNESFLGKDRMIKISNNIRLVTQGDPKRIKLPFGIYLFVNPKHKDKKLNQPWMGATTA